MKKGLEPTIEQVIKEFAPCGIDCSRCASFKDGEIVSHSKALQNALTQFENMAERTKGFVPVMNHYIEFAAVLDHFTKGSCLGCRVSDSPNAMCAAKTCHKEKGVAFCFQCDSFPCERNTYNPELREKWLNNNNAMKTDGLIEYYKGCKSKPRY